MRRAHAEETRKTQRRNARVDRLQRAAEDFRANIYAEGRLQSRPAIVRGHGGARQDARQIALGRALRGLLKNRINKMIQSRRHRRGVRRAASHFRIIWSP